MALSKIQSESINLADDYAFTGTITGAGGGKVLQFKQFTSSTAVNSTAGRIPNDDTVPTSSEGALVMSASFTPTSATSDIFILCNIFANEHSNAVSTIFIPLFAGTTHLQTIMYPPEADPGQMVTLGVNAPLWLNIHPEAQMLLHILSVVVLLEHQEHLNQLPQRHLYKTQELATPY